MSEPADEELPVTSFRAVRGGGATARFAAAEAELLRSLVVQVAGLLADDLPAGQDGGQEPAGPQDTEAAIEDLLGLSASSRLPDDPALARLLPDAYPGDEAAAGEFRRYTERGLRSGKVAAARTVLGTLPEDGGQVRLTQQDAQAWLRSLNDVRLVLGVRLKVTEDRDEMLERAGLGGPGAAALWVYDWLSFLQESLVRALW